MSECHRSGVMTLAIPVHIVDYDPQWAVQANGYCARISSLGDIILSVHHVGSTAVPGLAAKPVIDIMAVVSSIADLDLRQSDVEALGLGWHGEFGVDGRRFCTLDDAGGTRLANIHFYGADSPHPLRHIAFRDYLAAFPDIAAAYAAEKRRAATIQPKDSVAYSAEKNAWIRKVELAALDWYGDERPAG